MPNTAKPPKHALVAALLLLALIVLQVAYLAEHADWALSHPVKGAHWETLAGHGTEHPSDFLPGGYTTQNRDAILLFLAATVLLVAPLLRLGLLRQQWVALLTVLCLAVTFAVAILYSERRYFRGIEDIRGETAELREQVRLPMNTVPRGYCEERIGLRLATPSGDWLMHLKCDSGLAYAIAQAPPAPGTRFRMQSGRDDRGNRVLLALEPL